MICTIISNGGTAMEKIQKLNLSNGSVIYCSGLDDDPEKLKSINSTSILEEMENLVMIIDKMTYAAGTGNSATTAPITDETYGETYIIEPVEEEEEEFPSIEIKHIRPAIDKSKPREIFNTTFMRRFQGNNKGRHWNRRKEK